MLRPWLEASRTILLWIHGKLELSDANTVVQTPHLIYWICNERPVEYDAEGENPKIEQGITFIIDGEA